MKRVAVQRCCNPFKLPCHTKSRPDDLRPVPTWISDTYATMPDEKICSRCRSKRRWQQEEDEKDDHTEDKDIEFFDKDEALKNLNQCLIFLNETPIDLKRKDSESYIRSTLERIKNVIVEKIFGFKEEQQEELNLIEKNILESLKNQHETTDDQDLKQSLIQLCPKTWSYRKIKKEVPSASIYSIKKLKQSTNTPRASRNSDSSLENSIKQFYCNDDISRIMPGKNDFKSVKVIYNTFKKFMFFLKINVFQRWKINGCIFKKDYYYVISKKFMQNTKRNIPTIKLGFLNLHP